MATMCNHGDQVTTATIYTQNNQVTAPDHQAHHSAPVVQHPQRSRNPQPGRCHALRLLSSHHRTIITLAAPGATKPPFKPDR